MLFKKKKNSDNVKKLETLYDMYSKLLCGIAYDILQESAAAEDAVHETFVRLIDSTDKISEEDSPAARNFLAIICRNIAINIYNRRKKENECTYSENELLSAVSDTYNPERILISRESVDTIVKSLENLDEKYRDVVLLSRVYKMSNEEIAKTIGLTTEAVKKRLQRAKKMIAADLEEKENRSGHKIQ